MTGRRVAAVLVMTVTLLVSGWFGKPTRGEHTVLPPGWVIRG